MSKYSVVDKFCAHANCKNTFRTNKNVKYHLLPKNIDLINKWLVAIGRYDLKDEFDAGKLILGKYYVCSDHFTQRDYGKTRLLPYVVPGKNEVSINKLAFVQKQVHIKQEAIKAEHSQEELEKINELILKVNQESHEDKEQEIESQKDYRVFFKCVGKITPFRTKNNKLKYFLLTKHKGNSIWKEIRTV